MAAPRSIRVAAKEFPMRKACQHVLAVGAPRVGKSLTMQIALSDYYARGPLDQSLVVDLDGGETLDFCRWRADVSGVPLHVLDPEYRDSIEPLWHPLTKTESRRKAFAAKLCMESGGAGRASGGNGDDFFRLNAESLFYYPITCMDHWGAAWRLADLLRIVDNPAVLTWLCVNTQRVGFDPIERLGKSNGSQDVITTARMYASQLMPCAAYMLRAKKRLDLLDYEGSLVMVGRDDDPVAWQRLFSLITELKSQARLTQRKPVGHLLLYLDELRQLEPVKCLGAVLRRGSKKKMMVAASLHEVAGMHDRYGEKLAEELMALFATKLFYRVLSPATAKWAAEYLGNVEVVTDTLPPRGEKSIRRDVRERYNVHPDELRRLPVADAESDVITCYVDEPEGTYRAEFPWLEDVTPPKGFSLPERELLPEGSDIMPRFTLDDAIRLGWPSGNFKALKEILK